MVSLGNKVLLAPDGDVEVCFYNSMKTCDKSDQNIGIVFKKKKHLYSYKETSALQTRKEQ